MNVIVDVRGMNVNPTLLTNQQPVSCTCLAPKARNSTRVRHRTDSPWRTWGSAPGFMGPKEKRQR